MHHRDEELRKAVALFRYGLIADVLRLAPGSPDIGRTLHEKAQRTYVIPGTRRTRVAVETMRDWLSLFGIALIHARPCQPAGKGNIERFFRTLRAAGLAHLTAEATESLHTLNRTLWAWVEGEYPSPPTADSTGVPPSTRGPSQATTCALPSPAQTSTTSSSSRPNAA